MKGKMLSEFERSRANRELEEKKKEILKRSRKKEKFFAICEVTVRKEWDAPNAMKVYPRIESSSEEEVIQMVKGLDKGNKLIIQNKVINSNVDFNKRIDRPNGSEDLIWSTGGKY